MLTGTALPKVKGLTTDQCEAMVRLNHLPAFKDLVSKVEADEVSRDVSSKGLLRLVKTKNVIGRFVLQIM